MAPHFSILIWKIHGQSETMGQSPWGRKSGKRLAKEAKRQKQIANRTNPSSLIFLPCSYVQIIVSSISQPRSLSSGPHYGQLFFDPYLVGPIPTGQEPSGPKGQVYPQPMSLPPSNLLLGPVVLGSPESLLVIQPRPHNPFHSLNQVLF